MELVQGIRQRHPRMGARKLLHELRPQMALLGITRVEISSSTSWRGRPNFLRARLLRVSADLMLCILVGGGTSRLKVPLPNRPLPFTYAL